MATYKNITDRSIIVLINGSRKTIKPGQTLNSDNLINIYGLTLVEPIKNTSLPIVNKQEIVEITKENDMRIDLSDCTFNIPVRVESEDRKRNLAIVLNYIQKHFKTNVLICEQDSSSKVKGMWEPNWSSFCKLIFIDDMTPHFHKTRCLNIMARASTTPIIISHDSDVLLFPEHYENARNMIRFNHLDFCYPFNQPLHDIPKEHLNIIKNNYALNAIIGKTKTPHSSPPPGGCFFIDKKKFIDAGMENENMISYGPEDIERVTRIKKLGYRVASLPGVIYHMEHIKIGSSLENHEFAQQNEAEFNKIKYLPTELLRAYVQRWSWRHG